MWACASAVTHYSLTGLFTDNIKFIFPEIRKASDKLNLGWISKIRIYNLSQKSLVLMKSVCSWPILNFCWLQLSYRFCPGLWKNVFIWIDQKWHQFKDKQMARKGSHIPSVKKEINNQLLLISCYFVFYFLYIWMIKIN